MTATADPTALERQTRRILKLKEVGISRTSLMVHEAARGLLDQIRPFLIDPALAKILQKALHSANHEQPKAAVSRLSPFRYPGGKSWLVGTLREWLLHLPTPPQRFVEPFAGGANCGLYVAAESLAERVTLCEMDVAVSSVWQTIFHGQAADIQWLCRKIKSFQVSDAAVARLIASIPETTRELAFQTIVRNRVQRGGILAEGAGMLKMGENGKGLTSRWYPDTLNKRIRTLRKIREKVEFICGDAFDVIQQHREDRTVAFFVDPPYTAGGKSAGSRLYNHHELDHRQLFEQLANVHGPVLMTYDDAPEVLALAEEFRFAVSRVDMKSSHHKKHKELVITKQCTEGR